MDQDSAKKGSAGARNTWRDKLGIKKELPKISTEFTGPPRNVGHERREPSLVAAQVRAGASVKPAPMAPRVVAAPHVTANTELAERIRQQREAAERMAEQRIAEAKERAVPSPPAAGAQSPKPRFSFAEEELKQARQQPPATAPTTAPAGRWNQMPQQRPMFTAERYAPGSSADPRLGALPPGQRPGMRAGAMQYSPPPNVPATPRRVAPQPPPRPMSPAGEANWQGPGSARQRSGPPPSAFDPYRRDGPHTQDYGHANPYVDENRHRAERGGANSFRDPADYRGAHARELSKVDDQGDDLFEDEQGPSPRRAEAHDYSQAYREYEVTHSEQSRRRLGPMLLLLSLVAVAAIAGGTIYLYQKNDAGAAVATGAEAVPVVAGDGQPVKAEPEAAAATDEPAESIQPGEQQVSLAPSAQTSAQRKQIYDRILGDTTLEEQEQLAPGEEQPLKPPSEDANSGPSLETQTDAASGQALDAEPLPLPLPPPPGGSADDETGGLDLGAQPRQPADGGETRVAEAAPGVASAAPASTEPDVQPATSATQPAPAQSATSGSRQVAAAAGSEDILSDNDPQQDLVVPNGSQNSAAVSPPPEPVLSGAGPVQIAPQQGGTVQAGTPNFGTLPQSVPNDTTIRKTKVGSRGSKSADTAGTRLSGANFNRQASPEQVASIDPALVTQPILPEPAPQVSEPQTAVPPSQPAQSEPSTAPAAPGFVMLFSSHRSEAEALAEFDRLRQRHAGLVGSLSPSVRKTNLGSSGTRYQLSLGTVRTREAAKKLCSSLFAAGEKDCIVRPR